MSGLWEGEVVVAIFYHICDFLGGKHTELTCMCRWMLCFGVQKYELLMHYLILADSNIQELFLSIGSKIQV